MSRNSGTNNSSNVNVTTTSGIRKYTLPRPDIQKNLNFRLGPPEFYPISNDNIEQEDTLNERTIAEGFVEPQLVQVCCTFYRTHVHQEEYGTFSTGNQFNTFDLRGRVLQSVKGKMTCVVSNALQRLSGKSFVVLNQSRKLTPVQPQRKEKVSQTLYP